MRPSRQPRVAPFHTCLVLVWLLALQSFAAPFVNFETAPIHPVALNPGSTILAVANLPDGRVEIFDVDAAGLKWRRSLPVGVDPVTVRFRSSTELWVVNHISDSITILDAVTGALIATLDTQDAPSDVVFSLDGILAFVSCSQPNLVQVFSVPERSSIKTIPIEGDRPKSLSLSPDGSKLFVAIFESGNGSTILGRRITHLDQPPAPTPADFADGPHGGQNPPPNAGTNFFPNINPGLPATNTPPRVTTIVKKDGAGRWMDDIGGDWTEYVSGAKAAFTGRRPGWDLKDNDLATIDLASGKVSYTSGLMNICMDLAVNPVSGAIAIIGTDGLNQIRFEPVLKSVFTRVELALVNGTNKVVKDLNSHLDYKRPFLPRSERLRTVGDPRSVVWNSAGTRLFVTGMGSHNLIMLDAEGKRIGEALTLPEGPVGLAFDAVHGRLYAFSRFNAAISIVDPSTLKIVQSIALFDPTPRAIRVGRKHLYDTHKNSGLGQLSCGSCHVDARVDRLAWDLGNPAGELKAINSTNRHLVAPGVTNHFHPMKGPMVTQTLQDIIGHEPFHWRGDRDGIEEFNGTFRDLQAADFQLTPQEMSEFKNFLETITFPPNPLRNVDNTLSVSLPLPGQKALGRDKLQAGAQLPNGNAQLGVNLFRSTATNGCILCHSLPTGLGPDRTFLNGSWRTLPLLTNKAHQTMLFALQRSSGLPFKIAQLRSLPDKLGFSLDDNSSRNGFGFLHDGSVDSLVRFVQDGFDFRTDKDTADMIAFLLSFTGSDLPVGSLTDPDRSPDVPGKDAHASVGKQFTFTNLLTNAGVERLIGIATNSNSRIEIIARTYSQGTIRGWLLDPSTNRFRSDRASEMAEWVDLRQKASPDSPLVLMVVPAGTGRRIAIDRDGDGILDGDELDSGSDPADPLSTPTNRGPLVIAIPRQDAFLGDNFRLQIPATDPDGDRADLKFFLTENSLIDLKVAGDGTISWKPPADTPAGFYTLSVSVADRGTPPLTNEVNIQIELHPLTLDLSLAREQGTDHLEFRWLATPGRNYRIESREQLNVDSWVNRSGDLTASATAMTWRLELPQQEAAGYFRLVLLP